MIVTPSILEADIASFISTLKKLLPYYQRFQIDIQDGVYIDNKTVSIDEMVDFFSNQKYPLEKTVQFDFDLMVDDPKVPLLRLQTFAKNIVIKNVLIHPEKIEDYHKLQSQFPHLAIGISLSPKDSVHRLMERFDLQTIPSVQIMTVAPGPQGQAFLPEMLKKIETLRLAYYRNSIYLDGAINDNTLPFILSNNYKPDVLCIGSFLTKTDKLKERVDYLNKEAI